MATDGKPRIADPARRRHRARDRGRGGASARGHRRLRVRRAASSAAPRSTLTARPSPTRCSTPAATPTRSSSAPSAGRSGTPPTPTRRARSRACSGLRKGLGLFANLRPVAPVRGAGRRQPAAAASVIAGTDLLVVRELTGGIYFGDKGREGDRGARRLRLHGRGDRAHRPRRLRGRAAPRRLAAAGHVGRQGERARDLAALARGRERRRRRLPRRRARPHARRQRRDAARRRPDAAST